MLALLVQEYSLLSLPYTCSCNSHITVVGIEPAYSCLTLAAGPLPTMPLGCVVSVPMHKCVCVRVSMFVCVLFSKI